MAPGEKITLFFVNSPWWVANNSLRDGMGLVEAVFVHQEDLEPAVRLDGDPGAREHHVDPVLVACRSWP